MHQALVAAFARICFPSIGRGAVFSCQELANIAWAVATLKVKDGSLIAALASCAQGQLQRGSPQAIANIAWAFASCACRHRPVMRALAEAALVKIDAFGVQE